MVLFLPILGWSCSGPLGRFDGSDRQRTCNLHEKRGDPRGGVPAAALIAKSVSFL